MTYIADIEKINRLAKSLKDTGIAANMEDAVRMAESIIVRSKTPEQRAKDMQADETKVLRDEVRELETDNKEAEPTAEVRAPTPEPVFEKAPEELKPEPATEAAPFKPALDKSSPNYDVTNEDATLSELMAEDAAGIYGTPDKPDTPSDLSDENDTGQAVPDDAEPGSDISEGIKTEPEPVDQEETLFDDMEDVPKYHAENAEETQTASEQPEEVVDEPPEAETPPDESIPQETMAEEPETLESEPSDEPETSPEEPTPTEEPTEEPEEEEKDLDESAPEETVEEEPETAPEEPDEAVEELTREIPVEPKQERPSLSDDQKKMADLSKIFNFAGK